MLAWAAVADKTNGRFLEMSAVVKPLSGTDSCEAPHFVGDQPVVVVDWYGASNYAKGD